jgi:tetratricopeptide (TPR) repeat protein
LSRTKSPRIRALLFQAGLLVLLVAMGCGSGGRHLTGDAPPSQALQRLYFEALNDLQKGTLDKAYTGFSACLDIDPKRSVFHFQLARINLQEEVFEDALSRVDQAIALAPENYDYHALRVRSLLGLHRFDEAVEEVCFLLEEKPTWAVMDYWTSEILRAYPSHNPTDAHAGILPLFDCFEDQVGLDRKLALEQLYALWIAADMETYWTRAEELLTRFPNDPELVLMLQNARHIAASEPAVRERIALEMGAFILQQPRDANTSRIALRYGRPVLSHSDWITMARYFVVLASEGAHPSIAYDLGYTLRLLFQRSKDVGLPVLDPPEIERLASLFAYDPTILGLCTDWLKGAENGLETAIRLAKMWRTAGGNEESSWNSSSDLFARQFDETGEAHPNWLDVTRDWCERFPASAKAYLGLAFAHYAAGQYDEALQAISRSSERNFQDDEALIESLNELEIRILSR